MKKPKRATAIKRSRNLSPLTRQKATGPRYHPATGQVLSETEGDSPYLPVKRQKRSGVR